MSTNDITGDKIISKPSNDNYASGHELIWGKKKKSTELWTDADEKRMDTIGQNGNEGTHYDKCSSD